MLRLSIVSLPAVAVAVMPMLVEVVLVVYVKDLIQV
jgi:hypothetical protein